MTANEGRLSRANYARLKRMPVAPADTAGSGWQARLGRLAVAATLGMARAGEVLPGPIVHRRGVRALSLPMTPGAKVLLIVPPFGSIWYPSLAAHLLQACGRQAGFEVDVLYANILLASWIGEYRYEQIGAESVTLIPERFFGRTAFGLPPLGQGADQMFDPVRVFGEQHGWLYQGLYPDGRATTLGGIRRAITVDQMRRLEATTDEWLNAVAAKIVAAGYQIVGCTTTFQQTAAAIAILKRVKQADPRIVTILGGANCEGEMADGLAGLDCGVDYFFSGESEDTFPSFVDSILQGQRVEARIIRGSPCSRMDALPPISSRQFFQQRTAFLPRSAPSRFAYLSFETSRGCWWGQKHHCTFCGLNGEGMGFRSKSPERALAELRQLLDESPTKNISMTDNIMPRDYFRTLVPRLQAELPGVSIFYEQKSNLSFTEMRTLRSGGIDTIQPGIEALSSRLLRLMRKGVSAARNLMVLRYGRILGVRLNWNLLCGFPDDDVTVYEETMALVPLLGHLQPPSGLWHLSIDRFSPYFFEPERHHVSNIRPLPVYGDVFPGCDLDKIAYHFIADYPTAAHQNLDLVRNLGDAVRRWNRAWERPYSRRPELKIVRHDGQYVLIDTRGLAGATEARLVAPDEAALLASTKPFSDSRAQREAIAARLAVSVDDLFVPLVVAAEDIFVELSDETRARPAPEAIPAASRLAPAL